MLTSRTSRTDFFRGHNGYSKNENPLYCPAGRLTATECVKSINLNSNLLYCIIFVFGLLNDLIAVPPATIIQTSVTTRQAQRNGRRRSCHPCVTECCIGSFNLSWRPKRRNISLIICPVPCNIAHGTSTTS